MIISAFHLFAKSFCFFHLTFFLSPSPNKIILAHEQLSLKFIVDTYRKTMISLHAFLPLLFIWVIQCYAQSGQPCYTDSDCYPDYRCRSSVGGYSTCQPRRTTYPPVIQGPPQVNILISLNIFEEITCSVVRFAFFTSCEVMNIFGSYQMLLPSL